MSIASQLDPKGKEVEINGKKYTENSKITFNMKAFISLIIIIGTIVGGAYYLIKDEVAGIKTDIKDVKTQINQLKDEDLKTIKETADATDGKMEMLMILINSNQVDVNDLSQPTDTINTLRPLNN